MLPLRVNNRIRAGRIALIDETGKQLGIVDTREALRLAGERNLDLVEVNPKVDPPIAKIMDYGKYEYRKAKRERQEKTKEKRGGDTKGVRIGLHASSHDLSFKAGQASKFLAKGHKVRVEIRLRGREKAMGEFAAKRINIFLTLLEGPFKVEQPPKRLPSGIVAILSK